MRTSRMLLLAVSVSSLSLAACNPFHRAPVTEVSTDVNLNSRWRASLVTPAELVGAVQMKGSATMEPGRNAGETKVSLNLDNATPGGVHPWQVHHGQCGQDEGMVGSFENYKPISIGDNGRGDATAMIPLTTPTNGRYYVSVQASADNSSTVVACGNLAAPTS